MIAQKREKRRKEVAEVFTPDELVKKMLDKLPAITWKEGKTFIDPCCGNGNFLVHVLQRKIKKGHSPIEALRTIYGLDIMRDNIRECRLRLLNVINKYEKVTKEHVKIVFQNVRSLSKSKYPNGSLDYDMSFNKNYTDETIDRFYKKIKK